MTALVDHHRHSLLKTTLAIAAAGFITLLGCSSEQATYAGRATAPMNSQVTSTSRAPLEPTTRSSSGSPKEKTSASFGPLKQINAGVLSVGYAEAGPADGPAVILLHGLAL